MNGDFNVKYGAAAFSQNKLGNTIIQAAYEYDSLHIVHLNLSYRGWYPIIDFGMDYGDLPTILKDKESNLSPNNNLKNKGIYLKLSLPLNLTQGKWLNGLNFSSSIQYSNLQYIPSASNKYTNGAIYNDNRIYFYRIKRKGLQNIFPQWGLQTEVRYIHPLNTKDLPSHFYFYQSFYTPGLFKNHGISAHIGYLNQESNKYLSYSRLPIVRGTNKFSENPEKMYTTSLNYAFPISYPDYNFGYFAYFKRIKAKLFADYAQIWNSELNNDVKNWNKTDFISTGIELSTNVVLLRSMLEFDFGIRIIYHPLTTDYFFEPLISFDLPY